MKFFADEMLGKLARWLRMSGIDVLYQKQTIDNFLIETAKQQQRIILTRDTHLIHRLKCEEYLFITHDHLQEQIQEFYHQFPSMLKQQNQLFRCVECNTPLESIEKKQIKEKVWPYVYQTQENFRTCPTCHRIYWEGTHVKKIKEKLNRMLDFSRT